MKAQEVNFATYQSSQQRVSLQNRTTNESNTTNKPPTQHVNTTFQPLQNHSPNTPPPKPLLFEEDDSSNNEFEDEFDDDLLDPMTETDLADMDDFIDSKRDDFPDDYLEFLKTFNQDNVIDEDEEDVEFNIEQVEKEDKEAIEDEEEYRFDNAVTVSTKEIQDLLRDAPKQIMSSKRGRKPNSHYKPETVVQIYPKPLRPMVPGAIIPEGINFTHQQQVQLEKQLQKHFQLLAQIHLLSHCAKQSRNNQTEKTGNAKELSKKLILDFEKRRNKSLLTKSIQNPVTSATENRRVTRSNTIFPYKEDDVYSIFHGVHGLEEIDSFFQLVESLPVDVELNGQNFGNMFFHDSDWVDRTLFPTFEKISMGRSKFTESEDRLLAMGLEKYGNDWKLIIAFFLPNKTEKQVLNRFKNICSNRGSSSNPIKLVQDVRRQPLNDVEHQLLLEGIKRFGPTQWEQISKVFLPHRKSNFLKKYWKEYETNPRPIEKKEDKVMTPTKVDLTINTQLSPITTQPLVPSPTTWKKPAEALPRRAIPTMNPVKPMSPLTMPPLAPRPPIQIAPKPQFVQQNVPLPNKQQPQVKMTPPPSNPIKLVDENSQSSLFGYLNEMGNSKSAFGLSEIQISNELSNSVQFEHEDLDSDNEGVVWEHEDLDLDDPIPVPKTPSKILWTKEEDRKILEYYLNLDIGDKSNPDDKSYVFYELVKSTNMKKSVEQIYERFLYLMTLWKK